VAELRSWKEIASHLDVGVRTAQGWERDRGLPVHRLPTGRLLAYSEELDAWKASGVALATARRWRWWAVAIAGVIALVSGLLVASARQSKVLSALRIVGSSVVGLDQAGVSLWEVSFGRALVRPEILGPQSLWVGTLGGRRVALVAPFTEEGSVPAPLVCFSERGERLWEYSPAKPVRVGKQVFTPPFRARTFTVLPDERIVLASGHHWYYPTQIAVLSPQGRLLREFWHAGHLYAVEPGRYEGRPVVFVGGVNNARHAATLLVLDPDSLEGAASEEDPDYQFPDLRQGNELARLTFPRSCLNRALEPYNQVPMLTPRADGIVVHTWEHLLLPHPSLMWYLNPDLTLQNVVYSDQFQAHHEHLQHVGKLDHKLTAADLERLGPPVRVR